jgi:hypothetical protein
VVFGIVQNPSKTGRQLVLLLLGRSHCECNVVYSRCAAEWSGWPIRKSGAEARRGEEKRSAASEQLMVEECDKRERPRRR